MKKKFIPYAIGVPNMGVGILWAMNMMLIPLLVGTVTTSNSKLALLVSMGAFTGIFVQYIAGLISDRSKFKMGRRKPFVLGGAFISAIFMITMPFVSSYALMFVVAFLFYFSLNFYQGPYYSLIPETVEENQLGLANGFSKVISVLGGAIIFVVGPMLWAKGQSLPFIVAAIMGIATVSIVWFIPENTDNVPKPNKITFDFIKFPSVMKLYISVFFVFLSYGCITPFFVKYCQEVLNLSQSVASTGLLCLTIVGALFAYPLGVLSDKIERRKVLLFGAFIFAAALVVAYFVTGAIGLYVTLSIIGIGFIAIQISIYSILAEIVPPARLGEFMGIINLFISLSQFIANNSMGFILDNFGFKLYFPISAILMFVAVLIILTSKFEKYKSA